MAQELPAIKNRETFEETTTTTESTTTISTTSTTAASISTSTNAPQSTTTNRPQIVEKLVALPSEKIQMNQPAHFRGRPGFRKPPMHFLKNRPPFAMMSPFHHRPMRPFSMKKPPPMNRYKMHQRPNQLQFNPKKPLYLSDLTKRPSKPSIIILQPQLLASVVSTTTAASLANITEAISTPKPVPQVLQVPDSLQISTLQQTKFVSPLLELPSPPTQAYDRYHIFKMRPAFNTGFHPESVVVETGFKPIVSTGFQDRMTENDDDDDAQVGVIINESGTNKPPQSFEPIFVPSPLDKAVAKKAPLMKQQRLKLSKKDGDVYKIIIKRSKSMSPDLETAAAERVDTYYLPPADSTDKPIETVQHPSNIDFESTGDDVNVGSPPDVVVTYDGKKVSGASLTARLSDRGSSVLDMRASKAAEFIKARPQFAPFKGELPPINVDFVNKNAPQLQATGFISRDLDTPPLVDPLPTSEFTKLVSIKHERYDDLKRKRGKRSPHHTPEHTAQQAREKNGNNSTKSLSCSVNNNYNIFFIALLVTFLLKF